MTLTAAKPGDAVAPPRDPRRLHLALALFIVALGLALRWVPAAKFHGVGFDEQLYRRYVLLLDGGEHRIAVPNTDRRTAAEYSLRLESGGLAAYPDLCEFFLTAQSRDTAMCELPPTRFLYIYTAWLWKKVAFGDAPALDPKGLRFATLDPALVSLHRVASLFTSLLFVLVGVAAWRMAGPRFGLGVLALVATAPIQLHLSQHALIDGFFAFWAALALWLLWENLQRPNHAGWLAAFGAALALMVTTKENSFFVFCALATLVAVNRWARFGTVTPRLLAALVLGPAAGVLFLVSLAGGVPEFLKIYQFLVARASSLDYARLTGDGPWYRYLVDLTIATPLVLALALGALLNRLRDHRALVFCAVFVAVTYVIMCHVRYGMNLRYASIWDFPLAFLAVAQLTALARAAGRRETLVLCVGLALVATFGAMQYSTFSVEHPLYEMGTGDLLRCVKILKTAPTP